ncbi:MAG: hypothetical protein HKN03_11320 [Acidimicrobiales bacterium]|nr:hypothetical protein [Acidimicrobiales bacterium]
MHDTLRPDDEATLRFVGRVGLAFTIALTIILVIHPFGTTDLYSDGEQFLDHVSAFWVAIHFAAVAVLFVFPLVIDTWARNLSAPEARAIGRLAALICTLGMAVGAIHLLGTDTMTFFFFQDTAAAGGGSEATTTSVDLLLRFHAATLTTWVSSFWFAVPAAVGVASLLDPKMPRWFAALAFAAAALQIPALALTLAERQWTTLSETILFRGGATLLIAVFFIMTIGMRGGSVHRLIPRGRDHEDMAAGERV